METRKRKKTRHEGKGVDARFSHANAFDALQDLEEADNVPVLAETPASTSNAVPDAREDGGVALARGLGELKLSNGAPRAAGMQLLPHWDSEFWTRYGNRLRVFGTEEEVCDLRSDSRPREAADGEPPATGVANHGDAPAQAGLWGMLDKVRQKIV